MSVLPYGNDDTEADFADDPALRVAFILLRGEVDYNFDRYNEICERRSRAALIREAKRREASRDDLSDGAQL